MGIKVTLISVSRMFCRDLPKGEIKMYKLIAAGILCIMLTACGGEKEAGRDIEKKSSVSEKESEIAANRDENLTSSVESSESNTDINKAGQEKIIDILNKVQQAEELVTFNFYQNDMYVLTKSEEGIVLRKYNMDTWEETTAVTEIDYGHAHEVFELVPTQAGVVVKRKIPFENDNNYVFDVKLNMISECKGLLADYSVRGGILYYYDREEGIVYSKEIDSGKISIIRELVAWESPVTEEAEYDDIVMIEELAVSNNEDYIFYVGLCHGKDKGENVWGYFDIDNIENDTMYKENKTFRVSEKGVIVTDTASGSYMMGQEPVLSEEYYYYCNGKERESRKFNNARESDQGVYSSEGNVLVTWCYDKISALDIVMVYNMPDNEIIETYTGENQKLTWVLYGHICEKFRIILDMYPIHESPDVFSPTGKFEILSMTW